MRDGLWRRDRAFALGLLDEVWPALLLGLVVSVGVLVWTLGEPGRPDLGVLHPGSTWPLTCLIPISAWVGMSATGGSAARLGFILARPIARWRWLIVRLSAGLAAVVLVSAIVQGAATLGGFLEPGPPLPLVVGAVVGALGVGALAGACATTETAGVGGTVVGLVFLLGPPVMLLDTYGVTWDAVDRAIGGWAWPWALGLAAFPMVGLRHVAAVLPRRQPGRIVQASALTGAGFFLTAVLGWIPIMEAATDPTNNPVLAIEGRGNGPRVLYTATKGEVDGLRIARGDGTVVGSWGRGRVRAQIVRSWLSEDGRLLAVLLVPPDRRGRKVALIDLETGAHVRSPRYGAELRVEQWVDGERTVVLSDRRAGLLDLSLERGRIRPIATPVTKNWGWGSALPASSRNGVVMHVKTHGPSWRLPGCTHVGVAFQGSNPAALPLGMFSGSVTAAEWLDDEHVAVIVAARVDAVDTIGEPARTDSWVFTVRTDGQIVTVLQVEGERFVGIKGPAMGPWRVRDGNGRLTWLDRQGEFGPWIRPYNLGSRRQPWLPHVLDHDGIHALDREGKLKELPPANAARRP